MSIELYKGVTLVKEINWILGYTDNDGEYEFYISSSEDYEGTNYRIKITDYTDSKVYDYSDYFSIEPKLVIKDPKDFLDSLPYGGVVAGIIIIGVIVGIIIIYRCRNKQSKVITKSDEKSIVKKIEIPEIIYCRECGAKINKEKVFCSKCGTKIK